MLLLHRQISLFRNQCGIRKSRASVSVGSLERFFSVIKNDNDNSSSRVVDLRSDTVTKPSKEMLKCALTAKLGDDVFGEDPTVLELEGHAAEMFGMNGALYVPTGTMANLVAMMAHGVGDDASEVMVGSHSHICVWEGGNISTIGRMHSRQLVEDELTAQISLSQIQRSVRKDDDDHFPRTRLLCLENTHNLLGGISLSPEYIQDAARACKELDIRLHIDGARLFNAATSQQKLHNLEGYVGVADSISICLSKGLGAPCGSLLLGKDEEFLRIAKRIRKRLGGGMRQVGVIASMGMYALQNNIERLELDQFRAQKLSSALKETDYYIVKKTESNMVFFSLPANDKDKKSLFVEELEKLYGVKISSGYKTLYDDTEYFRAAIHLDVDEDGIDRAIEGLSDLSLKFKR